MGQHWRRECEHGQLARSCNICEYEQEIAELKTERETASQDYADLLKDFRALRAAAQAVVDTEYCNDGYMNTSVGNNEFDALKAALDGDENE
jgi:hypothetical protein